MSDTEVKEESQATVTLKPELTEKPKPDNPDKPDNPAGIQTVSAEQDYTDEQDAIIQAFYGHVAHLLPENGRDYTVNFTFTGRHDECIVKLTGRTRMGIAFVKEIQNYFLNETNDGGNHV